MNTKTRVGFEHDDQGLAVALAFPLGYRVKRAVTGIEPVGQRRNATPAMCVPAQPQLLCDYVKRLTSIMFAGILRYTWLASWPVRSRSHNNLGSYAVW